MQILTGKLFKEMVLCGANTLHNNHPEIDALNVFPVPDGDTGTNMSMTFLLMLLLIAYVQEKMLLIKLL